MQANANTTKIGPGIRWHNGSSESFNGSFRDECRSIEWRRNWIDARAVLHEVAARELPYAEFLEQVLGEEVAAKTSENIAMRTARCSAIESSPPRSSTACCITRSRSTFVATPTG
jgi:hypothetical protein